MIDKTSLILYNARFIKNIENTFTKPVFKRRNKAVLVRRMHLYYNEFYDPNNKRNTNKENYKQSRRCLKIRIETNTKSNKTKLFISGNLRKWYKNVKSTNDLSFKDFVNAIDKLEKEIGLLQGTLWNAKVTKLEIGVCLRLTDDDRGLMLCIADYINFKKMTFCNETIKFKGADYDIIFYDKIKEIVNHESIKKKNGKSMNRKNFILRFEMQIRKMSNMTLQIKDNLNTLALIKKNWLVIGEVLMDKLYEVKFVDVISKLDYMQIKKGGIKDVKAILFCQRIRDIGVDNFLKITNAMEKKKGDTRDNILKVYNEYLDNNDQISYKQFLAEKLQNKIWVLSKV